MVVEVHSDQEFTKLINDNSFNVTIVDFTAAWCPPCRAIKPYFEDLARVYTDVQFLKVDVDNLPDVTSSAGVRSMPTFIIYKNGSKTSDVVEGANRDRLTKMVKKHSNKVLDNSNPNDNNFNGNERRSSSSSSSSSFFGFLKKCTIL